MASNKKEEGNPSFIQQTEQYSIENDMDRHSRDSQLQSKGFREALHNPQPSPYVHTTERMSAIDTDTAAINTFGRGIEAGLHLYEKYDQGPSIQQYVDDVTEITKAHEQGRIGDEVYRREMRRARNAAQNAYVNDPRAMAKLKDFENGGMYGEYKQWEASAWQISQEYSKISGRPATPWDEDFDAVQIPAVQKRAQLAMKVETSRNDLELLKNEDSVDLFKLKDTISEYSINISNFAKDYLVKRLDSGNPLTPEDITSMKTSLSTTILEFQNNPLISKHADKDFVKAQFNKFKTLTTLVNGLENITDYAIQQRKLKEIESFLTIEDIQTRIDARKDKAAGVTKQAIDNVVKYYKENHEDKYPYTLAVGAAKAYSGDKEAVKELVNKGRSGDSNAAYYGYSAGLNFEEDPATAFAAMLGTPVNSLYQIKEERGYEDQLRLKTRTSEVWNEAKAQFEELGKKTSMFNGKETPLSKQLRFKGFTSDGVNIRPLTGASEEAKNLARSVNNMLTKVLITRSYCTQNHCDFKKLSKNPKVKTYMMGLLRGIANAGER